MAGLSFNDGGVFVRGAIRRRGIGDMTGHTGHVGQHWPSPFLHHAGIAGRWCGQDYRGTQPMWWMVTPHVAMWSLMLHAMSALALA